MNQSSVEISCQKRRSLTVASSLSYMHNPLNQPSLPPSLTPPFFTHNMHTYPPSCACMHTHTHTHVSDVTSLAGCTVINLQITLPTVAFAVWPKSLILCTCKHTAARGVWEKISVFLEIASRAIFGAWNVFAGMLLQQSFADHFLPVVLGKHDSNSLDVRMKIHTC